jgi:hypothetical protein
MNRKLITQELSVVVAVKNSNPNLLNEDFLRYSGVVPSEWQLAQDPVYSNQVAQVVFSNGVSIATQADRVIFMEAIGEKDLDTVQVPSLVQRYVSALKLAQYQAIGINLRGYVEYLDEPTGAHDFMCVGLLAPGAWQQHGTEPMQASLNLVYKLGNQRQLNLSVNEAEIRFPDRDTQTVVLFSGNFNINLADTPVDERVSRIDYLLADWRSSYNEYQLLVQEKFLGQAYPSMNVSEAFPVLATY